LKKILLDSGDKIDIGIANLIGPIYKSIIKPTIFNMKYHDLSQ